MTVTYKSLPPKDRALVDIAILVKHYDKQIGTSTGTPVPLPEKEQLPALRDEVTADLGKIKGSEAFFISQAERILTTRMARRVKPLIDLLELTPEKLPQTANRNLSRQTSFLHRS